MIIGCQTALKESELIDRKNKGIKFIELNLSLIDLTNIEETVNKRHNLTKYGLTPYAFHPPYLNSIDKECVLGEMNLLARKENLNLIKRTIVIADKMVEGGNPIVILSIGGLSAENANEFSNRKKEVIQKDLWDLKNFINEKYPKVVLAVKNNTKTKEINGVNLNYAYGYEDDFITWIRELKSNNIGVALDVSNAMGVIHYNKIYNRDSYFNSISYFIHRYTKFLKIIHLGKGIDFASSKDNTMYPFEETNSDDMRIMREIFNVLKDLNYNDPITLTVKENSTENVLNYVKTRKCLIQALRK